MATTLSYNSNPTVDTLLCTSSSEKGKSAKDSLNVDGVVTVESNEHPGT